MARKEALEAGLKTDDATEKSRMCPMEGEGSRHTPFPQTHLPSFPRTCRSEGKCICQRGVSWPLVLGQQRPTTMSTMAMMTTMATKTKDVHVLGRTTRANVRMERTWRKDARRTWRGTSTKRSQRRCATYGGERDGQDGRPKPWDLAVLPAWCVAERNEKDDEVRRMELTEVSRASGC